MFFHSKLYSCKQVSFLCNYGILFYVLSELLPLTLLLIAILVMNISFTSGAVNGFILFAQVIDLLYIDVSNGLATFHELPGLFLPISLFMDSSTLTSSVESSSHSVYGKEPPFLMF